MEAETAAQIRKEAQESLEQNFTPSLARRLSRQFIEQTRQSVPRSPSSTRDNNRYYQSPTRDLAQSLVGPSEITKRYSTSTMSDRTTTEYRSRSLDRGIRRTNSLLEPCKYDRSERHSPRRSISLFDDDDCDDKLLPSLPKHIMTLGRKYKESIRSNVIGNARRDSFHGYRTDKIQEEPGDDTYLSACKEDIDNVAENGSISKERRYPCATRTLIRWIIPLPSPPPLPQACRPNLARSHPQNPCRIWVTTVNRSASLTFPRVSRIDCWRQRI